MTATFSRLREKRNSGPLGMSSRRGVVIVKKTTGASRPWNLSTVPTWTPARPRIASKARSQQSTWSL